MIEQNLILKPQHFFGSRIELEFPTTQLAMKLQRGLCLVRTNLYTLFKSKLCFAFDPGLYSPGSATRGT